MKSAKSKSKTPHSVQPFFGFRRDLLADLFSNTPNSLPKEATPRIFILGAKASGLKTYLKRFKGGDIPAWQVERIKEDESANSYQLTSETGPLWFLGHLAAKGKAASSPYALFRNILGQEFMKMRDLFSDGLNMEFVQCSDDEILGSLVGMGLAAYRFQENYQESTRTPKFPKLSFANQNQKFKKLLEQACAIAQSINLARHLVNLPGSTLNPDTYAEWIVQWFKGQKNLSIDILEKSELEKENMGLLLAVGRGSSHSPRLIHFKFRPQGSAKKKPVAFVGKGITFDTGGLDLKPASGMRMMKKDMGGSATLVGFANWLCESGANFPCDIYLAIADNAVDAESFRPGDIVKSRAGHTVEIHNTDAEGRLVMADAFDYAVTQKDEPSALIDFSTLTGAMRVALGPLIAGYFASDETLAKKIEEAAKDQGECVWRMPLFNEYWNYLKSSQADFSNASESGFAGAITAALFLQKFSKSVPWVHFDLYCWGDRPQNGLSEIGGNAQGLQTLIGLVESRAI